MELKKHSGINKKGRSLSRAGAVAMGSQSTPKKSTLKSGRKVKKR